MRVRAIRLRLLAAAAALLWGAAVVAVLLAYRPGVPIAVLVAACPLAGLVASLVALVWPPLARGPRAFAAVAWLGILELLLLAPSFGGLVAALRQPGAAPLLPSPEDAYGWFLALAAASLFGGLGLSRRVLGVTTVRRIRLALATLIAIALLAVGSGVSGVAVLATALVVSPPGGTAAAPPSGPGPAAFPPTCSTLPHAAAAAAVSLLAAGRVDGRQIGSVALHGTRVGDDERWSATLAGWPVEAGGEPASLAYARVGAVAWLRSGTAAWTTVPLQERIVPYVPVGATPAPVVVQDRATLDSEVIRVALSGRARLAAEDVGFELVDGASTRHCRLLAGGSIALQAFRPLRWLLGQAPLADTPAIADWRGSLDWWVTPDDELAMASVSVEGLVPGGWPTGLQATLQATLTVRRLGTSPPIRAPAP